jgi:murein DD-endopeptidase MepM/ murein hydrolase activator NlpD
MAHPYRPALYRPLFLPGGEEPPREWPVGLRELALSQTPAAPGQALAFRAEVGEGVGETAVFTATLGSNLMPTLRRGDKMIGLTGTNAFFGRGAPELAIATGDGPLWAQPWQFEDQEWTYQDLTLTGSAAQITREQIETERARLFGIWREVNGGMQWERPFQLPLANFLTVSADYGVRRSYNGGPYRSYHEGVDFSAYGGTPVLAPAAGTVALAENLAVRGGAVIIDHGLGVYSGYYHLSAIHVSVGDAVAPGQIVGEVGATGLSTGNHLHWDLLVDAVWVDAAAWREQGMGCWLRLSLDLPCS